MTLFMTASVALAFLMMLAEVWARRSPRVSAEACLLLGILTPGVIAMLAAMVSAGFFADGRPMPGAAWLILTLTNTYFAWEAWNDWRRRRRRKPERATGRVAQRLGRLVVVPR